MGGNAGLPATWSPQPEGDTMPSAPQKHTTALASEGPPCGLMGHQDIKFVFQRLFFK